METDGGGWTPVSRTTPQSENSVKYMDDYRFIDRKHYETGMYLVARRALVELRSLIGFTQLRWRCRKQSVGRTIDTTTTNDSAGAITVLTHFLENVSQPHACGSYVRLPYDDSILTQNCTEWGEQTGTWGHRNINRDFAIFHSGAHIRRKNALAFL
ncbi:uncharacterized protein LOC116620385 [Nematostella vectensis]|uniref:uncharacterized protein LOC116620385 n=1 Tax=Nematostella vectensis TaxID=45351 RepID=UPI0013905F52|nr:uncharacterized protein LOC116620385 [Nematostella vectensis]